MAGTSLFALIDDIAAVLDDVALLTKVAAKKTAGVLGDDLALNAQQVAGVQAEREWPVVWAVAKGSALNKLVLVPAALLIATLAPWAITPLLMAGGLYLCFEGVEKLAHRWLHSEAERSNERAALEAALSTPQVDLVAFEKEKIKGAIRTDFILSAEIITISLGTVAQQPWTLQLAVLSGVAALMTVFVYGLVAAIVKLDDVGLWLMGRSAQPGGFAWQGALGAGLLRFAPWLMKGLAVAGTLAMFLVGGGILVHGLAGVHHAIQGLEATLSALIGGGLASAAGAVAAGLVGVVAGAAALLVVQLVAKVRSGFQPRPGV